MILRGSCDNHFHSRRATDRTVPNRASSRRTVEGETSDSLRSRHAEKSASERLESWRAHRGVSRSAKDARRRSSHLAPGLAGATFSRYSAMASARVWRRAKHAAPKRGNGIEFTLTLQEARDLFQAQGGVCAVSGIPFDANFRAGAAIRRPYHASIDRIDSTKGYTKENCRWVCVVVNQALGEWGEEILYQVVAAITIKQGRRPQFT